MTMKNALMSAATAAMFVTAAIGSTVSAAEGEFYAGSHATPILFPVDQVVTGGVAWEKPGSGRKSTARDNRYQNDDMQGIR